MRLNKNCTMASTINGSSGFSLFEILIVVSIIGLLSAIAIPKTKLFLENIRLNTTANAIKHQLYMARSRSLGDPQIHCGVVFDTVNIPNTVQTFIDDGIPVGNNQYNPGSDHLFLSAYTLPRTFKLTISGVGHTNVVVFRGDGSAKIPGLTLTITNTNGLNKTKRISVLPSTGRIKTL